MVIRKTCDITMKIALQFSGQLRSVAKGYEYYERNLFDVYPGQVDVFIHTWWNGKNIGTTLDCYKDLIKDFDVEVPFNEEKINSRYPNVVDLKYPACNTYSMFYSMFKCNLFRKKYELLNDPYDVVIRTRFDYALNRTIIHYPINKNMLFVPNDRITVEHDFCSDMFAFGNPKVMDQYHNVFTNLDTFYDIGIPMNGEDMLSANLKTYGLTGENMVYIDMNNPFPPGPYNFNTHAIIRDDFTEFNQYRG